MAATIDVCHSRFRARVALTTLVLCHAYGSPSFNFLNQWISSVEFNLPPHTQNIPGLGDTETSGTCNAMSLEGINTTKNGMDIAFSIDGLGLSCSLKTHSYLGDVDVNFQLGELKGTKSSFSLGLAFPSDGGDPPLPQYIKADHCDGHFEVLSMTFTGGLLANAVDYTLRPIFSTVLSQSWFLCSFVDLKVVDIGSTFLLSEFSDNFRKGKQYGEPAIPSPPPPASNQDIVNIAANPIMPFLDKLFGTLMNSTSDQCINNLVPPKLQLPPKTALPVSLGPKGELNVIFNSLNITGLDSWSNLALVAPPGTDYELYFGLGLDTFAINASIRLELTPKDSSFDPLAEDFKLSFDMSHFAFDTDLFLLLNATTWGNYKFLELLQVGTLISGVEDAQILALDLFKKKLPFIGFEFEFIEGSGDQALEEGLANTVNAFAALLLDDYGSALGAWLRHETGTTARDDANTGIAMGLASPTTWTHAPPIFDNEFLHNVAFVASVIGYVFLVIVVAVRTRKLKKDVRSVQGKDATTWQSLATNPRLSRKTRIGLPLMIIATACLFISANAGIGIEINMAVTAEGKSVVNPPSVFPETLLRNVIDMWRSGDYLFAVFIGFYSSVWPYMKLIMMTLCWFMPAHKLSVRSRQLMLEFLDAVGKWSLVDTYISVMFMVAFDIHLSCLGAAPIIADICKAAGTDAAFRVYVEPTLGLHSLLIATLMSLSASLWMSFSHRYAEQIGEYGPAQDYDSVEGLGNKRRLGVLLQPEGAFSWLLYQWCVPVAFIVALVLCIFGIFTNTFRFEFMGVAGWLFGDAARTDLSLVSMAVTLPEHSIDPSSFGTYWLAFFFLIFSGATVLALLVTLLVLWVAPMTVKQHRHCLVIAQVLNSVAGLDVFVATVLVSVIELEKYADFILDELHLGGINEQLQNIIPKVPFVADKIPGDDYRIAIHSRLLPGFVLLGMGCLVSTVLGWVVMRKCSGALFDPEQRAIDDCIAGASSACCVVPP